MTVIEVYQIARELFLTTALLCLPPLLASLLVGVLISVFQAVTSVQEQTLSFVPRLAAVGLVIVLTLPWSLRLLMNLLDPHVVANLGGGSMISADVATLFLAFVRIATFVALLPPFAGRGLPRTVKIGLACALTLGMTTACRRRSNPRWSDVDLAGNARDHHGGLLAICLGLFLYPAKIAGEYLNQEVGLSFATNISALEPQSQGVLSQILEAIAVLLFMALNVDHYLYRFLQLSLERRPVGGPV